MITDTQIHLLWLVKKIQGCGSSISTESFHKNYEPTNKTEGIAPKLSL